MPIERPHATFCVGNSNVCPIFHVCEIMAIELPKVLDSNLSLKQRSKRVDDLNENWQTDGPFKYAYVCKIGMSRSSRLFAIQL